MKNLRVVGTLYLTAPVVKFNDAFSVSARCVTNTRHHRTLLNRALETFGDYRTSRYLQPDNGLLGIDILELKANNETKFDNLNFYDFVKKLNSLCGETLHLELDEEEFMTISESFSESNNVDASRVRKVIETANRHRGVISIVDENGEVIELGIPPNVSPNDRESMLIDVAEKTDFPLVKTNKGTYRIESNLPPDIKRGDKIKVLNAGPVEQRKFISGDAADLIPYLDQPTLFD